MNTILCLLLPLFTLLHSSWLLSLTNRQSKISSRTKFWRKQSYFVPDWSALISAIWATSFRRFSKAALRNFQNLRICLLSLYIQKRTARTACIWKLGLRSKCCQQILCWDTLISTLIQAMRMALSTRRESKSLHPSETDWCTSCSLGWNTLSILPCISGRLKENSNCVCGDRSRGRLQCMIWKQLLLCCSVRWAYERSFRCSWCTGLKKATDIFSWRRSFARTRWISLKWDSLLWWGSKCRIKSELC